MTEKEELEYEMKDEYDFSNARPNPYAERANRETTLVVIEPELYAVFRSAEAVNEALRLLVKAAALTSLPVEHKKAS